MASGLYVKLDASYEDDEKIIQAGEKAELLYVRSLCLVKRILSDGFVSDAHLPKFGLTSVNQRARKLAEVGLWDRDDGRGGYWIRAWPKHNRSAEDVKAQQAKAQADAVLGNHRRWHQDTPSPDCPHCEDAPDTPPDPPSESLPESGTRSGSVSPETEALPEAQADTEAPLPPDGGDADASNGQRSRDYLFEAVVEACAVDMEHLTKPERGKVNKAVKDLREAGASPEGVRARARNYRERWPEVDLTPTGLANNYSKLGTKPPGGQRLTGLAEVF